MADAASMNDPSIDVGLYTVIDSSNSNVVSKPPTVSVTNQNDPST
jgi:hypothetical protein